MLSWVGKKRRLRLEKKDSSHYNTSEACVKTLQTLYDKLANKNKTK